MVEPTVVSVVVMEFIQIIINNNNNYTIQLIIHHQKHFLQQTNWIDIRNYHISLVFSLIPCLINNNKRMMIIFVSFSYSLMCVCVWYFFRLLIFLQSYFFIFYNAHLMRFSFLPIIIVRFHFSPSVHWASKKHKECSLFY